MASLIPSCMDWHQPLSSIVDETIRATLMLFFAEAFSEEPPANTMPIASPAKIAMSNAFFISKLLCGFGSVKPTQNRLFLLDMVA